MSEAPPVRWLFIGTRVGPVVWLVARVYLGYLWLESGLEKLRDDAWMQGGLALKGFAAAAVESGTKGDHPQIAYGWYVSFLEWVRDVAYPWLAPTVVVLELLVGIALIAGAFVGLAAFVGVVLNLNFIFAGAAGTNALFLVLGLLLMMAWRNAGFLGFDHYLLPALGAPWTRTTRVRRHDAAPAPARAATSAASPKAR